MEGLIPFVIHAIKRRRDRNSYRCLRMHHHLPTLEPDPESELELEPAELAGNVGDSYHRPHRGTRSELPSSAPPTDARRRIGPSRSLRTTVSFPARSSDAAAA